MIPQVIPFLTAIVHLTTMEAAANLPDKITRYVPVKLVENQRIRYSYGYSYGNESHSRPPDGRESQRRFIDVRDGYDKEISRKMAKQVSTTTESSFYDYFFGKDDSNSGKEDDSDDEDDEDIDDDDDDDYDDSKKEDKKKNPLIRGVRRKHVNAHKLVFPLLMAYKLKFFTMLPLLVGSLVLLIGTTGIAGFFFALFSAALGLHVKPHYH